MGAFSINDLINGKSRQEKADYKEIWLNPYAVRPAPENTRQECRDIDKLADSFLLVGQEQPTVLARVDGEYRIIDGHRRNLANIHNLEQGYKEFEKVRYFYKEMTENIYELSLLAGNGYTQNLTDYEKVRLAARYKEALEKARDSGEIEMTGRIRDIVGEALGEKPTQMARYEKISNNLTVEAEEQFKDGKLGISAAYETAKLPPEDQKEIASKVAAGETIQAKDIAKRVQEKKQEKALREIAEKAEAAAAQAEKAARKSKDASITSSQAALAAEPLENAMNPPVSESDTEKWTTRDRAIYTLRQLMTIASYITEDDLLVLQDIFMAADNRAERNKGKIPQSKNCLSHNSGA